MCKDRVNTSSMVGCAQSALGNGYDDLAAQMSAKVPMRSPTPVEEATKLLGADAAHRSLAADQSLMLKMVMPYFRQSVTQLSQGMYSWFRHQGFWGQDAIHSGEQLRLKKTEKLALIMTEVSECIEAVRKGDYDNEGEELADTVVRILDYAGGFGIDLAAAFEHKMVQNYQRPFKHGKHF